MKIAIVCFNLSWQSGGPRLIFSSAKELKRKGHDVVIYAPDFDGKYFSELWQGLDIRVVKSTNKFISSEKPKNFFAWIKSKIDRERAQVKVAKNIALAIDDNFDVLNVHDYAYLTTFFYKKRNPAVKIIWTANDPPFMYLPKSNFFADILSRAYNAWKGIQAKKYFRLIDRVLVLDSYNESWARKKGLNPLITRLGVDLRFHVPVRDFTKKSAEKKVKLFGLGSLNKYRRYEDTILSVKLLRDLGYDASALIIANDMWNEKKYREEILGLIEKNNLKDYIDLRLTGVSEEGLIEAYKEADIFVYAMYVPPPRDGFGFSIGVFEAMTAGLPVILSKKTTSTEVLIDGENALFVDPMSPKEIAEKVKMLVDDPAFYENIALTGQRLVEKELTWDKYTDKLLGAVSHVGSKSKKD